ncbi:MAG: alpha/beta hydrolase [Myxococcales bacterium]|nr:alpha/beta hydrolase [Myxococcota bacterium]MDW8282599.1 alpha/beta hydrolase [Myxococcales bacterium]
MCRLRRAAHLPAGRWPLLLARGMSEETRTVEANGLRIAYLEQGQGPLVLLVHGFPDTAYSWRQTMSALAQAGFRAVAYFQRGYHPTAIPSDGRYDSDTLGRDLLALIPALGAEQAIVVGHDWGASAAYSAATLGPERLRLLVTLAVPHPAGVRPTLRLLWAVRHFFYLGLPGGARRARRNEFAYIDELVRRWSPAWQVPPGETEAVKAAFRQPGCLEAAVGYYRDLLRKGLPCSHRGRIAVPTVAFAGETDGAVGSEAFYQARTRFSGPYEVIRLPGGHFMHREHPEQFHRELLRVLDRFGRA